MKAANHFNIELWNLYIQQADKINKIDFINYLYLNLDTKRYNQVW